MRRVAVLGCSGSGKTTLLRRLAAALGLPVAYCDLFRSGWEEAHPALVAGERWVIDAMRLRTLDERLERAWSGRRLRRAERRLTLAAG